ncbi:hypothetical protein Trydic_g6620 [Trypoxylus dichotomus]
MNCRKQMTLDVQDSESDQNKNQTSNKEEIEAERLSHKTRRLLQRPSKPLASDNSIELQISKKIENAIAKLQMLEKELLVQVQRVRSKDRSFLFSIQENLTSNIRSISSLIRVGKEIIDGEDGSRKINISMIKTQLEGITSTACYFLQKEEKDNSDLEFIFEDTLIEDLLQSAKLNYRESNVYTLVPREELPADYEDNDDDIESISNSMLSSASSFIDSVDNRGREKLRSKKLINADSIEKWIQTSSAASHQPLQKKLCGPKDVRYIVETPSFRKGDRETVKVTHLMSPDCFYVQLLKLSGTLNKLSRNIDKHIRSNSIITVQIPELNNLYLVRYMSDGVTHWCRGRVIDEIPEQKMFSVYFIDYGNTTMVRREDIAILPSDLKQPIPLAIKCKFFDLYPTKGEWDSKAVYLMTKIIANNELLMIITEISADTLEVDLITTDCDTSVRDALKFLGYGIPYCKYPTDLDKIKKQLKNTESLKLYNKIEQYRKEDSVDVIITYAINPYNVYVNLKNSKNDLIKLHESMDAFYRENKKGYIFSPKEEMVVAILYSDGISTGWRRGVITQSTEGRGMVTAKLVDIGMIICVPWDQIRKLDGRFVAQDCQAKLVKMTHVIPPNGSEVWPPNSVDFFTKYIKSEAILRMVISETINPPEVVFFECFPDVHHCLNAMLVKNGFADSTGDLSATIDWPQLGYNSPKDSDESFTISMMKTIQATNHDQETSAKDPNSDEELSDHIWKKPIEVISAKSPDLIYVFFTDNKEKMHEFQLELKHFYTKNRMTAPVQWEVGHTCVVNHRKRYYRGIIMEVLSNDKYLVSLSDSAISVDVKAKQLGILDARFTAEPQFAIRCHLADITPAGGTDKWSAMACEFLQDVLGKNDKLYLARKGVIDKERKSMPVVIWYTEFLPGGALESSKTILHSVNKLLLKNGLALKPTVKRTNEKTKDNDVSSQRDATTCENKEDDKESIESVSTETEDHECSSSASSCSVAGALKPSSSSKIDWNDLIEIQKQYPEQIIRDWMAPLPFKSTEFTAVPTFVNDVGEIFLHDIEIEPLLKDMEEKMLQYFDSRSESDIDINWAPGEMCSVRYFANRKWYRGKVLNVTDSLIKVVMVDYGSEDDCNIKDLSKEILYYDLPIFANRITLDGIFPRQNQWLTSDLDILHAQIVDKQVNIHLTTQQIVGIPTPAIVKLGTLNINEFIMSYSNNLSRINRPRIVGSQPAAPSSSEDVIVGDSILDNIYNQSDNDVIIEDSCSTEELDEKIVSATPTKELDVTFDNVKLSYKRSPLFASFKPGDKFDIVIINVPDYNKIVFELAATEQFEKGKEAFEEMSREISFFVPEQSPLKSFDIGQVCIAQYSEDGGWYRAQIIKELSDEEVYIWFVDFGNFESVKKEHVKETQDCWLEIPVDHQMAIIHGIKITKEEDRQKALNTMALYCEVENMCQTAEIVTDDPLSVKLYKKGSDMLSYQSLIDSGLLQIDGDDVVEENDSQDVCKPNSTEDEKRNTN